MTNEESDLPQDTSCRRHGGRLGQEELQSSLGTVVNMSVSGMCVRTRRRVRGPLTVTINSNRGNLEIECEVVRVERRGLLDYEIGLHFIEPSPELSKALTEIVSCHRFRRVF